MSGHKQYLRKSYEQKIIWACIHKTSCDDSKDRGDLTKQS